jgi:glycosyltransferase involved in cell wall biosynthesis
VWDSYVATRLEEAVQSLLDQDRSARIIIVDNASDIAIPAREGVCVVRSGRRLSLGAARNLGLSQVKTPYVIFWDADDVMLPGTLSFLEEALSRSTEMLAYAAAIIEQPPGRRHRWPRPWVGRLLPHPMLFAVLDSVWSLYPTTGATIMRTDAVRAANGFADSESGEDWCLGVALAFRGRLGWSERPGRIYHLHDQSVLARHQTARDQLEHAATLRARLRRDGDVPRWVRAALPLMALAQCCALLGHEFVSVARRLGIRSD